jgi:hypothetical protein
MRQMQPDSKASQVMNVLREGPSTTSEIVAELGWNHRNVNTHLSNLFLRKKITRTPFPTGTKKVAYLWELPP